MSRLLIVRATAAVIAVVLLIAAWRNNESWLVMVAVAVVIVAVAISQRG